MAPPPGQLRVWKYFLTLFLVIAGMYALVFLAGGGSVKERLTPKLGLDLQGGTTVTLRAATPDGGAPDKKQLNEAREIIESRVNGSGVAEFEVLVEGDRNLVVNIPGHNDEDLKKIGEPAELRFRQVMNQIPSEKSPKGFKRPVPSAEAPQPKQADVLAKFSPSAQQAVATAAQSGTPLDFSADPALPTEFGPIATLNTAEIAVLPNDFLLYVPSITCADLNQRPPGSVRNEKIQVVACAKDAKSKMLLDKTNVLGTDIKEASSYLDQSEGWTVGMKFTNKGQDRWTKLTEKALNQQVAVVLDNTVVSDPRINQVIAGDATINGSGINKSTAQDIANKLKYGALPLSFKTESTYEVSPTLGIAQLKAGLLAGGIGIALVVLYSLLYYRILGLVTVASLVVSGAIIYASIILLGRQIGFTLTLAGVAGFIVAIGITADSFVVFFERLKDEVMSGRSVRSAVARAWVRARKTILSADAISFLAAAVLYILSVGAVKGFAFTLGLSTLVDVLIVFLFTHPLVALMARSKTFTSPRISGLGNAKPTDATIARARGTSGLAVAKES